MGKLNWPFWLVSCLNVVKFLASLHGVVWQVIGISITLRLMSNIVACWCGCCHQRARNCWCGALAGWNWSLASDQHAVGRLLDALRLVAWHVCAIMLTVRLFNIGTRDVPKERCQSEL